MSRKYRLVGGWWISSERSFWLKIGLGAWVEQPMNAQLDLPAGGGYAYPTYDGGGDDLLYILTADINTAISNYPGWVAAGLSVGLDLATGIITINWDDADALGALQIRFDHPTDPHNHNNSYFLHGLLRMTATHTTVIALAGGGSGVAVGSRTHGYGLYPLRYMLSDLSEFEARVSQAVADQGQVQTLRTAMLEKYRLGIRTDKAYPRAAAWNDYHALVDFMEHAASGRPFRAYPDKTIDTPFADVSNPFGWRAWVMDKDSASWRPTPAVDGYYKVLDAELLAWQYLE